MSPPDKRSHARAQYFVRSAPVLPAIAEDHPGLSGRSASAIPARVLDMGAGGLQILTDPRQPVPPGEYALELFTEHETPFAEGHIRLLWNKPDDGAIRNGFEFVSGYAPLGEVEAMIRHDEQRLLRCLLHPLNSSAS